MRSFQTLRFFAFALLVVSTALGVVACNEEDTGSIRGTITIEGGGDPTDEVVSLHEVEGTDVGSNRGLLLNEETVGADGSFFFSDVPVGLVEVSAGGPTQYVPSIERATVVAGETVSVDLVLRGYAPPPADTGWVQGTITIEGGGDPTDEVVSLHEVEGTDVGSNRGLLLNEETVGADGSFFFSDVPVGLVEVSAGGPTQYVPSIERATVVAGETVTVDLVLSGYAPPPPPGE